MAKRVKHVHLYGEEAVAVVNDFVSKACKSASFWRTVAFGSLYICGKIIVRQHRELTELREKAEESKKGD